MKKFLSSRYSGYSILVIAVCERYFLTEIIRKDAIDEEVNSHAYPMKGLDDESENL